MASKALAQLKTALGSARSSMQPYQHAPQLIRQDELLEILDQVVEKLPIVIVGGDIWHEHEGRFDLMSNWSVERKPSEGAPDYSKRSIVETRTVLMQAARQHDPMTLFIDIVAKDAFTGEPLAR